MSSSTYGNISKRKLKVAGDVELFKKVFGIA